MRNILLFDLDGTLFNTEEGITNCVQYALESYGIKEKNKSELRKFIGPPLHQSFQMFYGFPEDKAIEATAKYRERYKDKGIFECTPYDGIKELLELLHNKGVILAIATSKPEIFATRIIEKFGMAEYFTEIVGSLMDNSRSKKAEVIQEVIDRLGIDNTKDNVYMIGDREHDILGAKEKALPSVGVYYGFAHEGELEKAGANYIANTVDELRLRLIDIVDKSLN